MKCLSFNVAPGCFPQILLYLRMCLASDAGVTLRSTNLADMQVDAPAIGHYIRTLLSSDEQPSGSKGAEANPVHIYMDLLQQLLSAVGGNSLNLGLKCLKKCLHYSKMIDSENQTKLVLWHFSASC